MEGAILGGGFVGTLGLLVLLVWWLGKSEYRKGKAETELEALKAAEEARSRADEIMSSPVADESAWVDRVHKAHRDR